MLRRKLEAIGSVVVTCAILSGPAIAEGRDGAYRGTMVCTKLSNSQFILRAPLDITISGKAVVAARPVFDLQGRFVVASEIATGSIGDDGAISFSSNWQGGASSFAGTYSGTITEKTGTLTGTQNWTTVNGKEIRNCTAAIVLTGS
jgi:hypothetical protein